MTEGLPARLQDARVNLAAHPLLWPASRLARRLGRVRQLPGLGLVVSDAAIAHDVLSRDREFTKNGPGSIAEVMTQAFGRDALANMDGEAHRSFRQRLGPLADPSHGASWLAASDAPLRAAIGALQQGRRVDMSTVARTLSGRLTLTLMGATPDAPDDEIDALARDVHALGERIASALRLEPLSARILADVQRDHERLIGYAREAFARADLPPASLVARLKALACNESETRGVLSIFFVAGALTLGVAIPRLVALIADSGAFGRLRDEPELVNVAVDEGMRFICPVPATLRVAAADTMLGGRRVRAGTRVLVLTANCARDDALFPEPNHFDITRRHDARARYLWYGAGPHFCLGFALAQRTLRHVVGELAQLRGTLRVEARTSARGVLLPAWSSLQLRLERAS